MERVTSTGATRRPRPAPARRRGRDLPDAGPRPRRPAAAGLARARRRAHRDRARRRAGRRPAGGLPAGGHAGGPRLRHPSRGRPGPARPGHHPAVRIGAAAAARGGPAHPARPGRQVGATAHLTVVDGGEALAIAVVEPSWTSYHVAYRIGTRHALDRGAAGRAILAARAGPDGFVATDGELQSGAHGIAARWSAWPVSRRPSAWCRWSSWTPRPSGPRCAPRRAPSPRCCADPASSR